MPCKLRPTDGQQVFDRRDRYEQQALEEQADQLLAAGPRPARTEAYPFHFDSNLRKKRRLDAQQAAAEFDPRGAQIDPVELARRLADRLPLPPRQRLALRLALRGYSRRRIARRLGVHPAQITRWLQQAVARLAELGHRRPWPQSRQELIQAVYREEVRRWGYRPERHCEPGQEACRHTGRCTRRWYLLYEEE